MAAPAADSLAFYDDRIVGYISVPFEDAEEILKDGYVCSMYWSKPPDYEWFPPPGRTKCHTGRKSVPFSTDRTTAVKAMHKHREGVQFSILLEIRKIGKDKSTFPYTIRPDKNYIILNDDFVLAATYLHDGMAIRRGLTDYTSAPCPFCNQIWDANAAQHMPAIRGKVGLSCYVGDAFMVVPCPNVDCIEAQKKRQERLDTKPSRTLYHACSRTTANLIKDCGGKFLRGAGGAAGGGIYFSHTPRETWWKAEDGAYGQKGGRAPMKWLKSKETKPDWKETDYVFFECEVKMGNFFEGKREEKDTTFKELVQHPDGPFDSCILDRGNTGHPVPASPVMAATTAGSQYPVGTILSTRAEDVASGKATAPHPGYEFIVYSWDQVRIIRELPFAEIDPPPAGDTWKGL